MAMSRQVDALAWAEEEFGGADLGDERLNERVVSLAASLMAAPEKSLPQVVGTNAELKALYRFLSNSRVDMDSICAPHFESTVERVVAAQVVYAVHDTTAPSFASGKTLLAHLSLMLTTDEQRRPLGALAVECWDRDTSNSQRKRNSLARYKNPHKESLRWLRAVHAVEDRLEGRASAIHLMDREADAYFIFAGMVKRGARFIVRMSHDRPIESHGPPERVSDALAKAPLCLIREVPLSKRSALSARTGAERPPQSLRKHPPRNSRMAKLDIRATTVVLEKPAKTEIDLPKQLKVNVVLVQEVDCPAGQPPVQWRLITNEPIADENAVARIVDGYRARWRIEEFNSALKTGCALESRQLETRESLVNLLALSIPVAWQLLLLRSDARQPSSVPASVALTPTQLAVLREFAPAPLKKMPTLRDAMLSVAALGGHIKNNGEPGWRVLHRGLRKLLDLEAGWLARERARSPGPRSSKRSGQS